MDCAKAVGARAVSHQKGVGRMKGILRFLRPLTTLIAIPTTADIGSESVYQDCKNRIVRENMLHAAYKAGVAFSKSYAGYIHAAAHSLGGQYRTPHGFANAVIMPYVLEAYGETVYKSFKSSVQRRAYAPRSKPIRMPRKLL